jgi:hypothetical protein
MIDTEIATPIDTPRPTVKNAQREIWPVVAMCGFLAAPILHVLASTPAFLLEENFVRVMASGGYVLSQQNAALMMVATYVLHVGVFGGFALAVASGQTKHQSRCALTALISCSFWWYWMLSLIDSQYPTTDLSRVLLDQSSHVIGLGTASVAGMAAAVLIRLTQDFLRARAFKFAPVRLEV